MTDSVLDAPPILDRFSLEGRTALVTGGGSGIGRAIAHALVEAGARVALSGRTLAKLETVAAELEAKGGEAITIVADVSDEASVDAMLATVVQHFGGLTIGVNNAAAFGSAPAEDMSLSDWQRVVDTSLTGAFLCGRAEARVMLPAGYGKIINISSVSGTVINAGVKQVAYNASKAGLIHLGKALSVEWAARGVRVNTISPGHTASATVDDAAMQRYIEENPEASEWVARVIAETPMKKLVSPAGLQGAAVFLASAASDDVVGLDLIVDAGYVLP